MKFGFSTPVLLGTSDLVKKNQELDAFIALLQERTFLRSDDAEFESKHSRDNDGQFSSGGGGGGGDGGNSGGGGGKKEPKPKPVKPWTPAQVKANPQASAARFKGQPDGTYDPCTGKPLAKTSGFQASFERTGVNLSAEQFAQHVKDFQNKTGAEMNVGVFCGTPEVSFTAKTKEQALQLARRYNQHSVFDPVRGKPRSSGRGRIARTP